MTSQQPDPIWVPTGRDIAAAGITAFAEQAAAVRGYRGESYLDLWRWSVEHLDDFWAAVWDHFDVRRLTWAQLRAEVAAVAALLQQLGVSRGASRS